MDIARIVGFVAIVTLVTMGIYNGGELASFIDIGAIALVVGLTLGGFLMSAGRHTGKAVCAAFGGCELEEELQVGRRATCTARLCALGGGLFTACSGVMMVVASRGRPGSIGPGMALALLGLFWAVFLAYFILRPLQAGVERRLAESGATDVSHSEAPLDLLVLVGVLVTVLTAYMLVTGGVVKSTA